MIEIWRKDAVYTFDFWPGAEVKPLAELRFRVEGSDITVSYKWPKDHGYASAREVVAKVEERCLRIHSEEFPVLSSGVKPFGLDGGAAWRCELDLLRGEAAMEAIGAEYDDGLVVAFERSPEDRAAVLATSGSLEILARRTVRTDRAKLCPDEGELSYQLGPVQVVAPEAWTLDPQILATLVGDRRSEFHNLRLEFAETSDPPSGWSKIPHYVEGYLVDDDFTLVTTDTVRSDFRGGMATSTCWGAVPPLSEATERTPYPVETTVLTVIGWTNGGSCRIWADQSVPYLEFGQETELAGLRDLILRIAMSSRRSPRIAE